jgi:MYXO-CTERM domain-containing protein
MGNERWLVAALPLFLGCTDAAAPRDALRFTSHNETQRFSFDIGAEGVQVNGTDWTLGLAWVGAGEAPVAMATGVTVSDDSATLERAGGDSEWFVDGPRGLEHGFTLAKRPDDSAGELVLDIDVAGLKPVVAGGDVALLSSNGSRVAMYSHLLAFDAMGRVLPSRFSATGTTIRVHVDDAGARYPLVIDPLIWSGEQKFTGAVAAYNDELGTSIALDGTTAIVGAPQHNGTDTASGNVRVFDKVGGQWVHQQELFWATGGNSDHFGISVDIDGDTLIVGEEQGGTSAEGAAHVYLRSAGTWTFEQRLLPSLTGSAIYFGSDVALDGDTAVVSAPWLGGATFVYVRNTGTWTEEQVLPVTYGRAVGVSGDTLVVGTRLDDDLGLDAGAAEVWVRNTGTWTLEEKITASDGAAHEHFGEPVALEGDTILVGSERGNGTVYVFRRNAGDWTQVQKLTASDSTGGFGRAIDMLGDQAIIGAYEGAFVFISNAGVWSEQQKLTASDVTNNDFGEAVAIGLVDALVGAPDDDDNGTRAGAAYAYALGLTDGDACSAEAECTSGFCVDDVCCDALCDAPCHACNLAGSIGACLPVAAGDDPADECAAGACDGQGGCKLDDGEPCVSPVECSSGACADGLCCYAQFDGVCEACNLAGAVGVCTPISAGEDPDDECSDVCSGDASCAADIGGSCVTDAQCALGTCVDDVCCESACDGPCEACDLATSPGTCAPIPAGDDPADECSAGACDGARQCATDEERPNDGGSGGSANDATSDPEGCSCRAVPPPRREGAAWLALVVALALVRRRRCADHRR